MSTSDRVIFPLTVQLPCGVHEWRKAVGGGRWNPTDWTGGTVITVYRKVKTQDSSAAIVVMLLL